MYIVMTDVKYETRPVRTRSIICCYKSLRLVFRCSSINPLNDLGDLFRGQLTGMSASLLLYDEQTVCAIARHNHEARVTSIHCIGIG